MSQRVSGLIAAGASEQAWQLCRLLVQEARSTCEWAAVADAAVCFRASSDPRLNARVHALCLEVLPGLADDPIRRARVQAQLAATSDRFRPGAPGTELAPAEVVDPTAGFLRIQGEYAAQSTVDDLGERLRIADQAILHGERTGETEYRCWGLLWRMDVLWMLGQRSAVQSELMALRPLTELVNSEAWAARLALIDAAQRMLEGRFAEAATLVAQAEALDPQGEPGYLSLVFSSLRSLLTGQGLDESIDKVLHAVDQLPHLARVWPCQLLIAAGRHDEARRMWSTVTPHVEELSPRATEWIVGMCDMARICVALGDLVTAAVIRERLLPYEGLQAAPLSRTPYLGPVALALGQVETLLGMADSARRHLELALATCRELQAMPHLAEAHTALAELEGAGSAAARRHRRQALAVVNEFGLSPLGARLASLQPADPLGVLTAREREIAALLGRDLSNAQIAAELTVSERTVETHVSSILRKLGMPHRHAVAKLVDAIT